MATSALPPCVKLTGGKRGAPGPLIVTTSDEDSASDGETLPQASPRAPLTTRISPRTSLFDTYPNLKLDFSQRIDRSERPDRLDRSEWLDRSERSEIRTQHVRIPSPSPTPATNQQAFDGYEHDHDYENVASPSGSSTASGPVYVRPPGFQHHAQEIRQDVRRRKKKSSGLLDRRQGLKSRAPTPPKVKPRRDPLPMRMRALPQSFWKQPNNPGALSPGNIFSSLPPLHTMKDDDVVADVRPITPPEERQEQRDQTKKLAKVPERKVIVSGDTEQLLKRLFAGVTDQDKHKNATHLTRGRPPRKVNIHHKSTAKGLLSGDDPYMIDSAVTQKLFPQLSLESGLRPMHGHTMHAPPLHGQSTLQLITLREGDKSVTLPSLQMEQNYSQMLTELVMNI